MRVIFMGTPEFAVASLDALVKGGVNIVAVITAPDKPAGRGMKLTESPVKKYAVRHNIKVLQPEKLKSPDFIAELQSLQADLQVVVAFRMLPEIVWNMPPKGTINLHASLLPQYRGAAPINWAIINGETETGVTTFRLKHEIDTGGILLQDKLVIGEDETAGELHDRMKETGAKLLLTTVLSLAHGDIVERPQDESADLKTAPKIFTSTCRIDWNKNISEIYDLIRGLSPFPAAFTELKDKTLKIFKADKQKTVPTSKPGKWESDAKTYLKFAAADGYLLLKEVQLEGKKRMTIDEFLRGYRF